MSFSSSSGRILAIELSSKGFGFAVLERPARLLDWGVVHVKGRDTTDRLKRVGLLIARYQPDLVVVQDERAPGFRQGRRSRLLIRAIRTFASRKHIRSRCVVWRTVREIIVPRSVSE